VRGEGRIVVSRRFGFALIGILIWLLFTSWLPQRICLSISQCGIFLLVFFWLRLLRQGRVLLSGGMASWMFILPSIGLLQLAAGQAVYPWRTAVTTLDWATYAAAGWLSAQIAGNFDFSREFQRVLVNTGFVVSTVGALHWLYSPGRILWFFVDPYQLHLTFPLLNHSHFAAFVELALPPAIWAAIKAGKADLFHTSAAAVMICAVWVSGSRSGSLIVLFELLAVILLSLLHLRPRVIPWPRVGILLVSAVVLVASVGWQGVAARFAAPPRDDLRGIFRQATIGMIKDRPLWGFGLGSFNTVYPAYAPVDTGLFVEHAHDDWLEWMAEGGVVSTGMFCLLAVLAIRRAATMPWFFGVIAVFIQALVEFPLHKPAVLVWQLAALGCMAADSRSPGMGLKAYPK
jgi:O-antigen ligase